MGQSRGRAEIPNREWIEFEGQISSDGRVEELKFRAWGCHSLLEAGQIAAQKFLGKKIDEVMWPGSNHWDMMISEALAKMTGSFTLPIEDEELCHCRKIPTEKVDSAIVLGADTPEKVRAWTSASSGCGTCRPNIEKLISFRLKKV